MATVVGYRSSPRWSWRCGEGADRLRRAWGRTWACLWTSSLTPASASCSFSSSAVQQLRRPSSTASVHETERRKARVSAVKIAVAMGCREEARQRRERRSRIVVYLGLGRVVATVEAAVAQQGFAILLVVHERVVEVVGSEQSGLW